MLYREHGHELPEDLWATLVGTTHAPWSPMEHLEELVGEPLDRVALNERRYAYELALIEAEELRPGIVDYIAAARRHGLKRAIVSSSSRRWIDMHLARLEETVGWDAICTADGDPVRAKPAPTLYLEALRCSTSTRRKRSSSRTPRTASAPRRPPASTASPSRTRSRASSVSTPREPTFSSTRSPTCLPRSCLAASRRPWRI